MSAFRQSWLVVSRVWRPTARDRLVLQTLLQRAVHVDVDRRTDVVLSDSGMVSRLPNTVTSPMDDCSLPCIEPLAEIRALAGNSAEI
jgi:hypothetical protein